MRFPKILVPIFAALVAYLALSAQSVDWQWLCYSSAEGNEICSAIAVDSAGNTLVAGECIASCQFGAFSHDAGTGYFAFVAKADAQGNWLWLQWTGSSANSVEVDAIKVDAAGNSYITGYFAGTVSFGSTNLTSAGALDVFIAKLSPAGAWLWARKNGGTADDRGYGLALNSSDNVYVTGSTDGQVFIITYSSSGAPLGGVTYPSTTSAGGRDIWIDSSGNAFVAGEFTGSITFGTTTLTSAGNSDIFIVKITSAGNIDWARRAGGTSMDGINSLCLDSTSTVYLTGFFYGTAAFGAQNLTSVGNSDLYVARIGSAGNWLGAVRAGGPGYDFGNAIAVANASAIYLAGSFSETGSFGGTILTSVGSYDMFVAKLNSAGTWLWAKGAGSAGVEAAYGLALDSGEELRVGGSYEEVMTVGNQVLPDADPGAYNYAEAFLFKIGAVIPQAPQNLSLEISGGNVILTWPPVTQTIYGQLVTPDEYIIYRSSTLTIEGPYTELGRISGTSYTHEYVGFAEQRFFYRVSAYKF